SFCAAKAQARPARNGSHEFESLRPPHRPRHPEARGRENGTQRATPARRRTEHTRQGTQRPVSEAQVSRPRHSTHLLALSGDVVTLRSAHQNGHYVCLVATTTAVIVARDPSRACAFRRLPPRVSQTI